MNKVELCVGCGKEFTRQYPNQRYCSGECRIKARRIRGWKHKNEPREVTATPRITINDMVKAMIRLSKERGYTVQYGELQTDLMMGKVKVRGGKII